MAQFAWMVACPNCGAERGDPCRFYRQPTCERRIDAAHAEGRPGDGAVTQIRCACGMQRCAADPEVRADQVNPGHCSALWVERPRPAPRVTAGGTYNPMPPSSFEPSKLRACRSCRAIYVLTMYEEERLPARPSVPEFGA